MGFFDRLVNFLGLKKKECNVLIVGLDNSGKTTLLNHFKPEEQRVGEIVPTVGFNVEKFKSTTFLMCDPTKSISALFVLTVAHLVAIFVNAPWKIQQESNQEASCWFQTS